MYEDEYGEEETRGTDGRDSYYVRMREAAAIRAARATLQQSVRYQSTITTEFGNKQVYLRTFYL